MEMSTEPSNALHKEEELAVASAQPALSPASSSSASSFAGEDEATKKLPPAAPMLNTLDPAINEDVDEPSTTGDNGKGLTSAFGRMKGRAATAKKTLKPQLSMANIKDKTSKKLDKYQPSIVKAKSSATAGLTTAASKVKEGSTHGWSVLKTKLAAARPAAGRIQTMGLNVMTDIYLGDTTVDTLENIEDPKGANSLFLLKYKTGNNVSESPSKAMGLLRRVRVIGNAHLNSQTTNTVSASPGNRCFATPYVLGTVLLFCGDLSTLARVSCVNKVCHDFIASEQRLEKFCVRYGQLSPRYRFAYWVKTARVRELCKADELDYDTYLQMGLSKGDATESISTDVRRTYGRVAPHKRAANYKDQESNEELSTQLSEILHALAGRFPAVGYCQGMDYIAANILNNVKLSGSTPDVKAEAERTFWLMVALFENYGLQEMFAPGLPTLHVHCFQAQRLLELTKPELAHHFSSEKVPIEMFAVGWFQTMYLYLNVLPLDSLDRIWDIFIFDHNWKIMLRVALALLQLSEKFVMNKPIDEIMQFFNTFADKADEILAETPLIEHALSLVVTKTVLSKLQKQHIKHKRGIPSKT
ncbi:5methylthioadenosine sadenosylhomocysteine deaminase [Plasmopara halstedii]|uniref:5methylthioadenosine sadenosylhomocysteine deaminase n=1 Tax=Plasmopara halstedii TaxID=4781 RepID=A0A0P1AEV8_PLAHL|nr:5methylthioadenosine sadenosylhomocysteine deaminase [Plasmopara halstedii]CEG39392.1 5methylthioadenosine sadenosylhomocysteine deaminase [Plasmopara halstedii]|eukprot:XP_024575761.1 5methylthioadenosine sadenosylhomocysteine deaminase [Plasmopara halstedii]